MSEPSHSLSNSRGAGSFPMSCWLQGSHILLDTFRHLHCHQHLTSAHWAQCARARAGHKLLPVAPVFLNNNHCCGAPKHSLPCSCGRAFSDHLPPGWAQGRGTPCCNRCSSSWHPGSIAFSYFCFFLFFFFSVNYFLISLFPSMTQHMSCTWAVVSAVAPGLIRPQNKEIERTHVCFAHEKWVHGCLSAADNADKLELFTMQFITSNNKLV